MAVANDRQRPIAVPRLDDIDEAQVRLSYDRAADTLWVSLVGEPPPAYNRYVDDDTMFRIDPRTGAVVGLEIERFLERALIPRPAID